MQQLKLFDALKFFRKSTFLFLNCSHPVAGRSNSNSSISSSSSSNSNISSSNEALLGLSSSRNNSNKLKRATTSSTAIAFPQTRFFAVEFKRKIRNSTTTSRSKLKVKGPLRSRSAAAATSTRRRRHRRRPSDASSRTSAQRRTASDDGPVNPVSLTCLRRSPTMLPLPSRRRRPSSRPPIPTGPTGPANIPRGKNF